MKTNHFRELLAVNRLIVFLLGCMAPALLLIAMAAHLAPRGRVTSLVVLIALMLLSLLYVFGFKKRQRTRWFVGAAANATAAWITLSGLAHGTAIEIASVAIVAGLFWILPLVFLVRGGLQSDLK